MKLKKSLVELDKTFNLGYVPPFSVKLADERLQAFSVITSRMAFSLLYASVLDWSASENHMFDCRISICFWHFFPNLSHHTCHFYIAFFICCPKSICTISSAPIIHHRSTCTGLRHWSIRSVLFWPLSSIYSIFLIVYRPITTYHGTMYYVNLISHIDIHLNGCLDALYFMHLCWYRCGAGLHTLYYRICESKI